MNKIEWSVVGISSTLISAFVGVLACQAAFSLCDPEYTEVIGQDCHYTSSIISLFLIAFFWVYVVTFIIFGCFVFLFSLVRRYLFKKKKGDEK